MKKTLDVWYELDGTISISIDGQTIAYGFTKAAAHLFCRGIVHGVESCGGQMVLTDNFFCLFI
jgi:mitochondrial fission protein ELM1